MLLAGICGWFGCFRPAQRRHVHCYCRSIIVLRTAAAPCRVEGDLGQISRDSDWPWLGISPLLQLGGGSSSSPLRRYNILPARPRDLGREDGEAECCCSPSSSASSRWRRPDATSQRPDASSRAAPPTAVLRATLAGRMARWSVAAACALRRPRAAGACGRLPGQQHLQLCLEGEEGVGNRRRRQG